MELRFQRARTTKDVDLTVLSRPPGEGDTRIDEELACEIDQHALEAIGGYLTETNGDLRHNGPEKLEEAAHEAEPFAVLNSR